MSAGNEPPFDIGDGGAGTPPGDEGSDSYLSFFSGIRDWFGSGFSKKDAGILALLAGGLANAGGEDFSVGSVVSLGSEVAATKEPGADSLVGVLVGFATNPIDFIWQAIFRKLLFFMIETILIVADTIISGIMVILFGSSIGFQTLDTKGRLGITDLGLALVDAVLNILVMMVTSYFDVYVWTIEWADPGTGTIWDGVIRTIMTFVVVSVSVWIGYRLLNAAAEIVATYYPPAAVVKSLVGGS